MSVQDKLRRLTRAPSGGPPAGEARPAIDPAIGPAIEPAPPGERPALALEAHPSALEARPLPPPPAPAQEPFLRRRTVLALPHAHGARRLSEVAALDATELARLGDAEGPAPGAPVFFDTETTSLASGAGVYVFLVGFARVEGDRFVVEQLYLTDPSAEAAMLGAAAEWILGAPLLVSFSGRGFDERRLEDRYRFLRLATPFRRGAHADLCPLARSLWRTRLPSCALGALEAAKLGVRRRGDLPGEQCPEAYFRSLRGDTAARDAVLAHNLADLLSTATLAVHALERAARSEEPSEVLGLGLHHLRRRRPAEALSHLLRAEALEARVPRLLREERTRLLLEAATLLRRAGREDEALRRWRALAEARPPSVDALLAIAKHAEHEQDDWDLAIRASAEALSLVRRGHAALTAARRRALEEDLVKRLARVEGKLGRAESGRILAG